MKSALIVVVADKSDAAPRDGVVLGVEILSDAEVPRFDVAFVRVRSDQSTAVGKVRINVAVVAETGSDGISKKFNSASIR